MASALSGMDLIGRLAESFLERLRQGERPLVDEYAAAHPHLADRIRDALSVLGLLEQCAVVPEGEAITRPPTGPEAPPEQLGPYRVLRELGRGGMAVVYEAEHLALRRRVALKILPGAMSRHSTALERFRREAQAAARLHHTNIVPVFEVGEDNGVWFYAMQLIPGQGLDQVLVELRRLRAGTATSPGAPSSAADLARSLIGEAKTEVVAETPTPAAGWPPSFRRSPNGPRTWCRPADD